MKKLYILILTTNFLFLSILSLSASHILSGEMVYTCNSAGNYTVDVIIYRNCNTGSASLDTEINISVIHNSEIIQVVTQDLTFSETVEYNPYENCNPNADFVCVEKGIYNFDINLPISDLEYTIAYQRCCFSHDILNIKSPERTGITIETTISSIAQSICNSTNALDFPLAFMSCPNQELSFPAPSFDSEGDSLSYQLCSIFKGGGDLGTPQNPGETESCESVTPNPACWPFSEIEYNEGFSAEYPFPSENGITLDPENGLLLFTPTVIGRYIYSLCISEFRDGEIIGLQRSILQLSNIVLPTVKHKENDPAKTVIFYKPSYHEINITNFSGNLNSLQFTSILGIQIPISPYKESSNAIIPVGDLHIGTYIISYETFNGEVKAKKLLIY